MVFSVKSSRRLVLLSALGALLGLIGGGAAWALVHLIGLVTSLALFHRWSWEAPSFAELDRTPLIPLVAMGGALGVTLLARWAPAIRGHGIPEAMEAVLERQSRIAPRVALAKPLSAAVAIGTGGPFGAEGPIIVTGGAAGSLLGQLLPVSPSERKILLASGAAAGMAATFGAPLAAVVLAVELLLFEFSTRALLPLVLAASVAAAMHQVLFGSDPLFEVPTQDFPGLASLPVFALLGIACGLVACVITRGLFLFEAGFRRLPVGDRWHPVIGAAGFGLVGLAAPRALGVGYDAIGDVLQARMALAAVAALAGAKLLAWWIALASGTSGGTLAPILLISAGFGSLFGAAVEHVAPGLGVSATACALVAMAAVFGSATRASFTGIVFVFELTRDYQAVVPLMVASVLAGLVTTALLSESLMTEKLARRGLRVANHYEVDALATVFVHQIMSAPVRTLRDAATVAEAQQIISRGGHSAYPVTDDEGRVVGVVTRGDLLELDRGADDPVLDHASQDVVSVPSGAVVRDALHLMLEEEVDHLPVIEAGRMVGIVTRTDILGVRRRGIEHDRPQPGAAARLAAHVRRRG
jgi:H+/Cl- antiporter ClcA